MVHCVYLISCILSCRCFINIKHLVHSQKRKLGRQRVLKSAHNKFDIFTINVNVSATKIFIHSKSQMFIEDLNRILCALTLIQVQKWNHTDATINNISDEIQQILSLPEIREIHHS